MAHAEIAAAASEFRIERVQQSDYRFETRLDDLGVPVLPTDEVPPRFGNTAARVRGRRGAATRLQAGSASARSSRPARPHALERGVFGIDAIDRPGEMTGAQVAPDGGADAVDTVRCADHDDPFRLQQPIRMANAYAWFKRPCSTRHVRRTADRVRQPGGPRKVVVRFDAVAADFSHRPRYLGRARPFVLRTARA